MKILVTGANGMLGKDLITELGNEFDVYGFMRGRDPRPRFYQCDITNRNSTIKGIERVNPQVVIHAAAMTDVDACENDRQSATRVNFEGTKNVVDGCRHVKAMCIYISTDFVFNGEQRDPYRETQLPHPINVYGESKLLGEFYVRDQSLRYLILRTSWLFGKNGRNFMSKILERAQESSELYVVNDQKGSPTYTKDLANGIHSILKYIRENGPSEKSTLNAIYHVSNRGVATRFEVARELLKQAHLEQVKINPMESLELKNIVKRPQNSALDNSRFEKTFGISLRPWQEAISDYLKEIPLKGEVSHQK